MNSDQFKQEYERIDSNIWSLDIDSTKNDFDSIFVEITNLEDYVRNRLDRSSMVIRLLFNLNDVVKRLKKEKDIIYKNSFEYMWKIKKRNSLLNTISRLSFVTSAILTVIFNNSYFLLILIVSIVAMLLRK